MNNNDFIQIPYVKSTPHQKSAFENTLIFANFLNTFPLLHGSALLINKVGNQTDSKIWLRDRLTTASDISVFLKVSTNLLKYCVCKGITNSQLLTLIRSKPPV